jgi:hypothetical protein
VANLFERLGRSPPEKEQPPVTIPRGPLLQPIVPPTDYNSSPIEKCLDWLVNRWPRNSVRVRDICLFGPNATRDRKSALALAQILEENGWLSRVKKPPRHDTILWEIVRRPSAEPKSPATTSSVSAPTVATVAPG